MKDKQDVISARVDSALVARLDLAKIITKKSRNAMIIEALDSYLSSYTCEQAREMAESLLVLADSFDEVKV